jgi:hypothetical protein
MLPYFEAPLLERAPIKGRLPMTNYEWLHTPVGLRNSSAAYAPNAYVMMENTGQIIPVVITDVGNIRKREDA